MTTYVGLLRAVNLGPHNRVPMKDLATLLTTIGLLDVRTLLASGNVVFRSSEASSGRLEKLLEEAVAKKMKVETDFFVRSAGEWEAIVKANPYPKMAKEDPGHLVMMCLKDAPSAAAITTLQKAIKGRETVKAKGRQAYFEYPDGIGSSKLTITMIERHLGTTGTARNWNTVVKLAALTSVLLLACVVSPLTAQTAGIQSLAWMSGSWGATIGGVEMEEHWTTAKSLHPDRDAS